MCCFVSFNFNFRYRSLGAAKRIPAPSRCEIRPGWNVNLGKCRLTRHCYTVLGAEVPVRGKVLHRYVQKDYVSNFWRFLHFRQSRATGERKQNNKQSRSNLTPRAACQRLLRLRTIPPFWSGWRTSITTTHDSVKSITFRSAPTCAR